MKSISKGKQGIILTRGVAEASFDTDTIITASIRISGVNQQDYTGTELFLIVIDENGNIVTT